MNNIPFKGFKKIIINYTDSEWICPSLESYIKTVWEKAKNIQNQVLYNGSLTRVISAKQEGNVLYLDTQRTDYAHHFSTRTNKDLELRANPLYAAILITLIDPDGKSYQVFGKSKGTEAHNQGRLNIIAGAVHPDIDNPDGAPSLGIALQRELIEEIGMTFEAFNGSIHPLFAVIEEEQQHLSVLYNGILKMERDDLNLRHSAVKERDVGLGKVPEFEELVFIENKSSLIHDAVLDDKLFHNRASVILDYYAKEYIK